MQVRCGLIQMDVFPACAGVIRGSGVPDQILRRFPRMRGGDPERGRAVARPFLFSPHARG